MLSPSNLYAEKIFSEHPTVLWALDDKADYLSLIEEDIRDISNTANWLIIGGMAQASSDIIGSPFGDSYLTKLISDKEDSNISITAISSDIFNFNDLNQSMGTFSIGAYFYSISPYIQAVEIGYQYLDGTDAVEISKIFNVSISNVWFFVSHTFDIPNSSSPAKVFIRIKHFVAEEESPEYGIYVNGLTVGQWAEEFNATSFGANKQLISENIALDIDYAVSATAYGLQDKNGYYLINESNQLMAKNTGIPLVFGASNNTTILPNSGMPSLIIPGQGFMNTDGAFKTYTFETWLRINGGSNSLRRIIGPISSEDGIYVDGPFLYLKIGKYSASHYVGEWYRPMLLQVRLLVSSASVLLNGEQVMIIDFGNDLPELASKLDELGKDQDWIGFYSYDDISPFEIDCVAIYSYAVPNVVAKRRWVYGQAVEAPETINAAFSGTSFFADYEAADYTKNLTYPDLARWDNATVENLNTGNNLLSTPVYPLPSFIFKEVGEEELINPAESNQTLLSNLLIDNSDAQDEQDLFIKLSPDESWDSYKSQILFPSANFMLEATSAIYLEVSEDSEISEEETILYIRNRVSKEYLSISTDLNSINYTYTKSDLSEQTLATFTKYSTNQKFFVGIDFEKARLSFGGDFARFLSDVQLLEVFVGNSPSFTTQFSGKIYSINFLNKRNSLELSSVFDDNGLIEYLSDSNDISMHKATYSVKPKLIFNNFVLDVDVKSSWQDYAPLSYFAQNYKDAEGNNAFGLDFIQLNLDYPRPPYLYEGILDTSESSVRAYITFQPLLGGANRDYREYSETVPLSKDNVVIPGSDWLSKRFEVVDNTIIYPPAGINLRNVAIVYHLDIFAENTRSQRIRMRKLELCSQVFNASSPNAIGTRLGNNIFPFKKTGIYFDYKSYNPFTTYKGSTPYLYMTANSGFKPVGQFTYGQSRGLSIPVNKEKSSFYKLASMQISIKFDNDEFPTVPVQIGEIQYANGTVALFIVSDHPTNKRGRIYAINANTGSIENRLSFYWNGNLTKNPMLDIKQWGMLGIAFAAKLDFASFTGAIRLTGPMTYNNISYYELTALQQLQESSRRPWLRVKYVKNDIAEWEYWADSFIWEEVLVLPIQSTYGANPLDIYKAYVGTNKIIATDDYVLTVKDYEYPVYRDLSLDTILIKPV